MTITALVVNVGEWPKAVVIPTQWDTYRAIQQAVESEFGDLFDVVSHTVPTHFHGYVNDSGILDGLPMNPIASVMLGQVVCGNVIMFGSLDDKGAFDGDEHDIPLVVVEACVRQHLIWQFSAVKAEEVSEVGRELSIILGGEKE